MADARIWRTTEADSTFISLPAVVKRMREELSSDQEHLLTWDQLVEQVKEKALFTSITAGPETEDLMEAVWMLASLWFLRRHPRARRKAVDFGMVVVEIACQDIASLGDFRAVIMNAHEVAHAELDRQEAQGAPAEQKAVAVIDALEAYFASGGKVMPAQPPGE